MVVFVRYIQVKGRQSNDIQAERFYSPAIGKQPGLALWNNKLGVHL